MSDARELARWLWVQGHRNPGDGGDRLGGCYAHPEGTESGAWAAPSRGWLASRLHRLAALPPPRRAVSRPRLFVELCAGLAAVSLRLQGGPRCRPPVSRMGSKAGYAKAVLAVLGLRAGQGADRYLWAEADDGCRALLAAYPRPEVLREAAAVIRGWADEEPRALWERLRAEGPIRGADGGEVARWAFVAGAAYRRGEPASGYDDAFGRVANGAKWSAGDPRSVFAERVGDWPGWPPVAIAADAREVTPPDDCDGVVVFLDPPYAGCTGYGHDLTRAEVLALARRWHDAGATVAVSEAVPLADALPGTWHAVDLTGARIGQRRTFSATTTEWLTTNRTPAWVPARQEALPFGRTEPAREVAK